MPKFEITSPDGKRYEVTAPDGASQEQVLAYAQQQFSPQTSGPTEGMSWMDKALAGAGKAFVDIGRGVKQATVGGGLGGAGLGDGSVDPAYQSYYDAEDQRGKDIQAEIDESRRLDAPLMRTGAGVFGNVAGNVATALPLAFVPGANTVAGSAALGGIYGALQPTSGDESRMGNAATGAALAGGTTAAVKGLAAGYRGAKSLVEPFTESGQSNIAARTMNRFTNNPEAAAAAAKSYRSPVQGVKPTLQEATLDPGMATLQRAVGSADPQIAASIAERQAQNNAARVGLLRSMGGDDAALEAAKASREKISGPLYQQAMKSDALVPQEMATLFERPAVKIALEKAKQIAANQGEDLADPANTMKGLHYVKLALDDMLDSNATTALGRNEKAAVMQAKTALVGMLDDLSPEYGQARQAHASASKPITQMKVAREILRKGSSATDDALGNPTLYPQGFNRAVRDSESVVRSAGGLRNQTLDDVMTPEQLQQIQSIAKDLSRQQAAQNLARPVGSNTVQNLSSQNLIEQSGIPKFLSKPAQALRWLRPLDFSDNDAAIRQKLAQALLDPEFAAELMSMTGQSRNVLLENALRYVPAATQLRPNTGQQ